MNIAIVIDADNASHDSLEEIIKETEKHGRIIIKRAYGDFIKNCCLNPWIDKLRNNGFEIRQNFNHSNGKNSTDIALVIDAMDIMHHHSVQGFCIVSSDSDFTHLAMRIKNQGLFCIGIGRFNTLPAFKNACDKFSHVENLKADIKPIINDDEVIKAEAPKLRGLSVMGKIELGHMKENNSNDPKQNSAIDAGNHLISEEDKLILLNAFELASDKSDIVLLSKISDTLKKTNPKFSYKKYGFQKFSQFIYTLTELFIVSVNSDGKTYKVQLNN